MNIVDIPDQIRNAFKYSLRSRGAFLLSLISAILVFAVAYDLIYGFWYARWYDVKDVHYQWPYFAGLFLVALIIPLAIGAGAYIRARMQERPFAEEQIGIAIAPFEVVSVDPKTLGTASALHALDIVSTQFFHIVQVTLREYPAAAELTFRFLPQYTKITSKKEAEQQRDKLRATLVIWGNITQRSRQPLEIKFEMQAAGQAYTFSNLTIEQFPMLPLQYFTFLEAAKAVEKRGEVDRANGLYAPARSLGEQLYKDHPPKGGANSIHDAAECPKADAGTPPASPEHTGG